MESHQTKKNEKEKKRVVYMRRKTLTEETLRTGTLGKAETRPAAVTPAFYSFKL
jgi:hypothetical protein